jgi:PilZ domain
LRPGQETVLSWSAGAVDCQVVAAAGSFVLLRPERPAAIGEELPSGQCSLTFLEGMIPMGWDGMVEFGSEPGELRFRVAASGTSADRRSSVRLPVMVSATVTAAGEVHECPMLDISAGGMRFKVAKRIVPGTSVHVRVVLPNGGPLIDSDAVSRASDPGFAAVEFTAMHAATAQEIGAWTVSQLRAGLAGRG